MEIRPIAHIHTDFPEKFGIPRQSGLVWDLKGTIVFEPEYRNADALRGMEEYSYLWLLWEFEGTKRDTFSPTIRPPRLGGNKRMGVFATRSPFRPNPIGLSCVRFESIEETAEGPVIHVSGIDLRDNTPIFDIKPYLPYVDAHPEALEGFAGRVRDKALDVTCPEEILACIPTDKQQALLEILAQDPRPSYQNDPERIYGVAFDQWNVRFRVNGSSLSVDAVEKRER